MVTRARFTADLISTVNANTSALANAVHISSSGDVTVANSITVGGNIPGYATNTYVYSTFAQNTAIYNLVSDRIQVANADVLYVTKATALTSNNAVVNLVNDRLQVANAAVTYVTKAVHLTSNTAVKSLIDDRLQVANAAVTYVTKATALTANNTLVNLTSDRLQVANAAVTYVTKGTALTANNTLVNLINDRIQVANAGVTYLTKSFALTSNNALVNLINDRIQAANVSTTLGTYWPSANVIAYTNSQVAASTKVVNTSIFVASGGENRVAIPYTNTNFIKVYLNGVLLTEDTDYVAANNAHIGGLVPALIAGDVLVVEEFKNHNANTINRSAGGGGSGFTYQGSSCGFVAGGYGAPGAQNVIDKYPFSSDTNASDFGDLSSARYYLTGQSSSTHGYTAGGDTGTIVNVIEKFPFSTPGNASDVGDLTTTLVAGTSGLSSGTYGYISGGATSYPTYVGYIQKYPFASDSNSTCIGSLTIGRGYTAGQSSSTHGYTSGGTGPFGNSNVIDKFSFSSDGNATDVGDLTNAFTAASGHSSSTDGFVTNGMTPLTSPAGISTIQKFSFASDGNASFFGTIGGAYPARRYAAGQSATSYGYTAGGSAPPYVASIEKFQFSASVPASSSNVGDLTVGRGFTAGGLQV